MCCFNFTWYWNPRWSAGFKPYKIISNISFYLDAVFWHGMLHSFRSVQQREHFLLEPLFLEHLLVHYWIQGGSQRALDYVYITSINIHCPRVTDTFSGTSQPKCTYGKDKNTDRNSPFQLKPSDFLKMHLSVYY